MAAPSKTGTGQHAFQPFKFDPSKKDEYLSVAAYSQETSEKTMIWFPPEEHLLVHDSLMNAFEKNATADLGKLEALPYELIRDVCLSLDLGSLFRFRQVNRSARVTVTSLREYKIIAEHATGALCAILRTGVSKWFTIRELDKVFRTKNCINCGQFGGFIQLLEFARYCKACVDSGGFFSPLSVGALRLHGLPFKEAEASFPMLTTLPGMYTLDYLPGRRRISLMKPEDVHKLADQRQEEKGREIRNKFLPQSVWREMDLVSKDIMWYEIRKAYGKIALHAFQYMTCTSLPFFDVAYNEIDRGVGCIGCFVVYGGFLGENVWWWRILGMIRLGCSYSRRGFLQHLQRCAGAQRCWTWSENGTKTIRTPSAPYLKLLLERACPRFPQDVRGRIGD